MRLLNLYLVTLACQVGCTADDSGLAGDGGDDASGGNGDGAGGSSLSTLGGGDNTGGSGAGSSCAADEFVAALPIDIFIMMDQSGSMNDVLSGGGTGWEAAKSAFNAFLSSNTMAGVGVGIQYFPLLKECSTHAECDLEGQPDTGACSSGKCVFPGSLCDTGLYGTPDVPIAALPGVQTAITASLDAHSPLGGTPMGVALSGALAHAKSWAAAHTDRSTIVLLATDGLPEPSDPCEPKTIPGVADIAEAGIAADPKIPTYVVGVGNELDALNTIAVAGGTNSAFLVDADANAPAALAAALASIRAKAVPCRYPLPDGAGADLTKVNVDATFTVGGKTKVFFVETADGCAAAGNQGWYYDDPSAPTSIVVCEGTCQALRDDVDASVSILVGCETEVPR